MTPPTVPAATAPMATVATTSEATLGIVIAASAMRVPKPPV
jgi:hypothetical protein